eukprot:CAMPEP_0176465522 /NCGR_PEP_ID=MMETSP0127-20121128/37319_1 /TAXON_ID=938130 /ORGANISM="Platyophrya macrostoma, Strain WH" /LENGTH=486 /DNA_ID=CAMNT_0017858459 /DNA_START=113 /DNA_END=1573 /DNA_ORIENTATION=-
MSAAATYVNPRVVEAQYAVRGLIPTRADALKAKLAAGEPLPFKELIYCNIGNPQALKQQPLSFNRQVMALVDAPMLLDNEAVVAALPTDVVARAREYLSKIGGKTGAYTDSIGYDWARKAVSDFIAKRDGTAEGPAIGDVVLTDGASTGVRLAMTTLLAGPEDGVLIPIPQYPLYTAQIALLNGSCAMYYLDESAGWAIPTVDLTRGIDTLKHKGATPRMLVVINPGNPTGQVLTRETMVDVVKFCYHNELLLLADEVYQENIYSTTKHFHSFRKVILGMEAPYNTTKCISLHSTSKGIIGECGRRGGYFEMLNIPHALKEQLLKMCSINLCSNVNGQVMTALMCTPPAETDASYASFHKEYTTIFESLKARAVHLAQELNTITGVTCNPVEGAMYAFPRIRLPAAYVAHNDALNHANGTTIAVDARWALELLEETGIVVVPGSGFLQQEGTLHFRTTILPPAEQMEHMTAAIRGFMDKIYAKYQH